MILETGFFHFDENNNIGFPNGNDGEYIVNGVLYDLLLPYNAACGTTA